MTFSSEISSRVVFIHERSWFLSRGQTGWAKNTPEKTISGLFLIKNHYFWPIHCFCSEVFHFFIWAKKRIFEQNDRKWSKLESNQSVLSRKCPDRQPSNHQNRPFLIENDIFSILYFPRIPIFVSNPLFFIRKRHFRYKKHIFQKWPNRGHTLGRGLLPNLPEYWFWTVWSESCRFDVLFDRFFYLHKSLVIECTVGKIKRHYRQSTVKGLHGLLLVKI